MHDLACVIHVHSTFSDGTATVEEIIAAARRAEADAVLLTDHDSRGAARAGFGGWHEDVLLLVGHEVTTRRGHLLVFGVEHEVDHRGRSEEQILAEVAAHGGVAFAAHPFSRGGVVPAIVRPHPWSALDDESCGVEVWSLVTDAAERWRTPLEVLRFVRDPLGQLDGPPPEHLRLWDQLGARRRVPAIGGLDAHQTGLRLGRRVLSPFPHQRYFRLLRTHVLLTQPPSRELAADERAVYQALRHGRCYLALDGLAPASGFAFEARRSGAPSDTAPAPMGSELPRGRWVLCARAPQPARLTLVKDGEPLDALDGQELQLEVDAPGVYRVEVRLPAPGGGRTWIVSNPIYIRT